MSEMVLCSSDNVGYLQATLKGGGFEAGDNGGSRGAKKMIPQDGAILRAGCRGCPDVLEDFFKSTVVAENALRLAGGEVIRCGFELIKFAVRRIILRDVMVDRA